MCETCGCSEPGNSYRIFKPGEAAIGVGAMQPEHYHHGTSGHHHNHGHDEHNHDYDSTNSKNEKQTISIEHDILETNNLLAERNRGYFEAKGILAFNLVSSPGSGKTSLLESTVKGLNKRNCFVIEGDQQTDNDARRIADTGASVVQINTGNACHLDAKMINEAIHQLKPTNHSLVFIENVGNLVCPALFDLGEQSRIVIFSVTEGEDKPLKYPNMFHTSDVCIISKTDLLPYLDFNMEQAKSNVLKINPYAKILEVSVKNGEGMESWLEWIESN